MNEETKRLCKREGAEAHTFTVDISNREAIYKNAEKSIQIYGRVDILCANAGIVQSKKFLECPDELMERTMQVNCTSLFYVSFFFLGDVLHIIFNHDF
jgi:short-subunit dehydrogenase